MGRFGDYRDNVLSLRSTDREIELLLTGKTTGSDELADLEVFVAALAQPTSHPHDSSHMATALAARARSSARPPARSRYKRLVVLGATLAVLTGLSGVALASDRAVPGDLLYGLDRAMESVGIGAGGIAERTAEFTVLLRRGDEAEAFAFLEEEIQKASTTDAAPVREHLEAARDEVSVARPISEPVELPSDPGAISEPMTSVASNEPVGQQNPPSGQEKTPPGQQNTPPGQEHPPPGQEKTPPGQDKSSPSSAGQTSSGNQGSNGNQDPSTNNGNTNPGTPQGQGNSQNQGQDNGNQGNGQGQGQGNQGQGNGQGQGQGNQGNQGQGQGNQGQGQDQG